MLRKVLAGVTVATVLAVGGVAVAGALSSTTTTTAPKPKTQEHARRGGGAGNLVALAIKTAAGTIGVDGKTLRAGVKSGHTIGQLAQQHHVSPSTVVHAIVTKLDAAIDAALKAGKIDASRATKARQRVPALADRLVNHTTVIMRGLRTDKHKYHGRKTFDAAAAAIGISTDALIDGMKAHKTIATIAREHGVSPAKAVAAMVAVAERNYAANTRAHRGFPHYAKAIPRIMNDLANGKWAKHHAVRRGSKARTHA